MTDGDLGWVSFTGDSWVELPPDLRARARQTVIDRHRARGPLLALVQVRVYAEDAEPQVSFVPGCALGPDAAARPSRRWLGGLATPWTRGAEVCPPYDPL